MKTPNNAGNGQGMEGGKAPSRKDMALRDFSVKRAHCGTTQDGKSWILADLELNGLTVYGVRVVSGKNGDFLSFPQRKGQDGKYYSIVYAPLCKEDQDAILKKIEQVLNE